MIENENEKVPAAADLSEREKACNKNVLTCNTLNNLTAHGDNIIS